MQQNIAKTGRIVRAASGFCFLVLATLPPAIHLPKSPTGQWIVAGALFAAGLFQLWEAKQGWCIARACGIKTRI